MTYNPNVPQTSDSPSTFPAQGSANFTRLQTLLGADHQFNISAAANDGYHNIVHLTQQAPSGALAATGRLYAASSGGNVNLFYMNDAGIAYQMSPSMPIRAAVNFNGISPVSIRSSYNIGSVTRLSTGRYQINFSTPMPDTNYIVQVTGMRNSSGSIAYVCVDGNSTYTSVYQVGSVIVDGFNNGGSPQDMLMMSVVILSVT